MVVILKKISFILFTAILVGILFSCQSSDVEKTDNFKTKATFIGTIEEINGSNAVVTITEGDILKSGSEANVDLSVAEDTNFQVGDKIKVGYDGSVGESFPLSINTTFVELMN